MPNGSMESQMPAWKYTQMKNENPGWSQNQIESKYRNGVSTSQPTAALGGPIKQFGYENPNGPYGGGGGGTGSGSSGPTNAASQWYEGVMKGDNLPYSPFAVKNLESQATDMNAAAEGARNEQMTGQAAANGASASDPSMQGAKMNSMARRQTDNTQAVNDIQSKANQANFSAQADAAAHMTQMKLAYDEMANSNAMRYSPFGSGGRSQSPQGGGEFWQPVGHRSSSGFLQMGGNVPQPIALPQRNKRPQQGGIWAGPDGSPPPRNAPGTVN